jgi:hypothetical protein
MLHDFREKVETVNNFQLALRFFGAEELPRGLSLKAKFRKLNTLSEDEYQLLNAYISDSGEHFNNPTEIESLLERDIARIYESRDVLKEKIGVSTMEQVCLLYLAAIQRKFVGQVKSKGGSEFYKLKTRE